MCHTSVLTWAASAIGPDLVAGKTVIEVGSYNVNGSVRGGIEAHGPASYVGVDISEGPGVDKVANVVDLWMDYLDSPGFDLVISTEMLEHVESWKQAMKSLVLLVRNGGHLAISTRSLGFPYHPYPVDTWRYSPADMVAIFEGAGLTVVSAVDDEEQPGVFAIARKPKDWQPWREWWPDLQLPLWDGSIPEDQ